MPVRDERGMFERLSLEAFQSGLSWATILRKRPAFREAFHGFDPEVVAAYGDGDVERLMADAGIVRNRAKVLATITNARATLGLREDPEGDLAAFVWSFRPARDPTAPDAGRGADDLARVAGAVEGAQAQGLRVRGPDDDVRAHGGGRHRRHPPARLAPPGHQRGLARLAKRRGPAGLASGHRGGAQGYPAPRREGPDCRRPCRSVELRGFEPLTPSMPWRCATNCATAPSGVPPKGATVSLPMTPRARPNRPQGGEDPVATPLPTRRSTSGAAIRRAPRAARPSGSCRARPAPARRPRGRARASTRPRPARRPVGGHDRARPRRQVASRASRPSPTRDEHVLHRLPVAPAAHVLAAQHGRPLLRPPLGDLRGREPLPGAGVDLAEARVQLDADAGRAAHALGGHPGAGQVGGDDAVG